MPLILSAEGDVWDGMHRIARAVLEGVKELEAVQFTINPEPDGTVPANEHVETDV